tara:strand:- start:469 stop:594 length:126 start_codon:yes stop_codon:yes gene_type:complete
MGKKDRFFFANILISGIVPIIKNALLPKINKSDKPKRNKTL